MREREQAFRALRKVENDQAYASLAIEAQGIEDRSLAFVRTIVLGVLRWRSRLDFVIERLSSRPLDRIQPDTLQLLRIGIYQLMFMDVPPYAAVAETVAVASTHAQRARSFINAVLRAASRADLMSLVPEDDSARAAAIRLGHPPWLFERWERRLGRDRARAIAEANRNLSFPDLLVNTRRISFEQARNLLEEKKVPYSPSALVDNVVKLEGPTTAVSEEISKGLFHPMDEGSSVIATLLPRCTGPILDLAAAPGGKTIALLMRGDEVISHDVSFRRMRFLREALPRLIGADGARLVVGDARRPPFRSRFEVVLLDAPCSATGTIRKNPEIKWRLDPRTIGEFARLQETLLHAALDLAGTECLYSTCSIEREENDALVERVLEARPEFRRIDLEERASIAVKAWIEQGVLRLTPDSGADGFTAFALRRVS